MIRIIVTPGKHNERATGIVYYKNGKMIGTIKVLQTLPRKPGQKDYEWEEVKIELE